MSVRRGEIRAWKCTAVLTLCCALTSGASTAPESKSAALAKDLSELMASRGIDAFAAQDRARPAFFVAVRSYPGVQLLLVGAESTAVEYVKYQVEHKNYGEAYTALHSSAVPATKLFVQDMGCDGLQRDGDPVDVVYHQASTQLLLDGNGKASALSKEAYTAKAAEADARYAELLQLVLKAIRADGAGNQAVSDPRRLDLPNGAAVAPAPR
jgi:hypothetical protein